MNMSIFDRFFGPPNIDRLRAKGDIRGLLRALEYNRGKREDLRRLRRQAVDALAEIGEPALQAAIDRYLDSRRKGGSTALILAIREIGRRAEDPALRLRAAQSLGDLLDLRKENRVPVLRAVFSLACRPNLPTFSPAAQAIFTPWLADPAPETRVEAALGMLITSLPGRNFAVINHWYSEVFSASREDPRYARRAAAALAEAAPLLQNGSAGVESGGIHMSSFAEKTVDILIRLNQKWNDQPHVREAMVSALAAYPNYAVPRLLSALEENPGESFLRDTLQEIGRRMIGTPRQSAFLEMVDPSSTRRGWEARGVIAQALGEAGWEPESDNTRVDQLVAAGNFNFSAWAAIPINREIVERLAATIDDPTYPAQTELIRHLTLLQSQISDREARFRLRGVLARCLENQPPKVQIFIVRALAELEWHPGTGTSAVIFWVYRGEWERATAVACSTLPSDLSGVDVLIESLSSPDQAARKTATRALSAVYQSESADGPARARIRAASINMEELLGHSDAATGGGNTLLE